MDTMHIILAAFVGGFFGAVAARVLCDYLQTLRNRKFLNQMTQDFDKALEAHRLTQDFDKALEARRKDPPC